MGCLSSHSVVVSHEVLASTAPTADSLPTESETGVTAVDAEAEGKAKFEIFRACVVDVIGSQIKVLTCAAMAGIVSFVLESLRIWRCMRP